MQQAQQTRKGYKLVRSSFGKYEEIPDDWELLQLEKIGEIVGGGTPDTAKAEYWVGGKIPWAVPTDLTQLKTNFIDTTERSITEKGLANSSAKILPEGTILISTRATIGEVAINRVPMTTNQGFQNLICDSSNHNLYMLYSVKFNKDRLLRLAYGTTFLEISKTAMKKVVIPCPRLPEQQKIGSILSKVDELIQKTDEIIEQIQRLEKGLMQMLLTKGIGHTKSKKVRWSTGRITEVPQEWNVAPLQDVCSNITDGKHGDCENDESSGFYFISAKDIFEGNIHYENARQITKSDFLDAHKRTKLEYGDILLTNSGSIGKMALAGNDPRTARTTFQKSVAILKPRTDRISSKYLFNYLSNNQRLLQDASAGSSQKNLLLIELRSFIIPVPSLDEQNRIGAILSSVQNCLQNEIAYRSSVRQLKKGIKQKLLTGQIRVKV